jgi:hypothetical protein
MKISSWLIAILIFGLFMTGFGSLYNDLQVQYDYNGTDLGGYDAYDKINTTAGDMGSSVKSGDTIIVDVLYIDKIVTTLKSLVDLPSTINTIIVDAGKDIGLPSWFINNLTTMIVIIIGFAIAGIIWRYNM